VGKLRKFRLLHRDIKKKWEYQVSWPGNLRGNSKGRITGAERPKRSNSVIARYSEGKQKNRYEKGRVLLPSVKNFY